MRNSTRAMAIVGNYLVVNDTNFVVFRRDTLEKCHVFWDSIKSILPGLFPSSTGAVVIHGTFGDEELGFHSMTVDNSNGTIENGCHLHAPSMNIYRYCIRCSWGSLVYGHELRQGSNLTTRVDVFDVSSSLGRSFEVLDDRGVAEVVAAKQGVFLFMDDGEIQYHIGCAEIQRYYKSFVF
jgi:hypothetical protein